MKLALSAKPRHTPNASRRAKGDAVAEPLRSRG